MSQKEFHEQKPISLTKESHKESKRVPPEPILKSVRPRPTRLTSSTSSLLQLPQATPLPVVSSFIPATKQVSTKEDVMPNLKSLKEFYIIMHITFIPVSSY
jgi:hypothetical protein